jgi:hypothetical protein
MSAPVWLERDYEGAVLFRKQAAGKSIHNQGVRMNKNIILIIILVVCAGAWIYLDYLNKQEQDSARQMRMSMEQLKARH